MLRRSIPVVVVWMGVLAAGCGDAGGLPDPRGPDGSVGRDAAVPADGCGDGTCSASESCSSCAADCGACGGGGCGVDFATEVQPILSSCTGCHGGDSGLRLGSLAGILAGGDHGPAVVPCDCESSLLIRKLGAAPPFGAQMPLGGALSAAQIDVLCRWIDEGAEARFDPATCGRPAPPGECGGGCGDGACDASESCESCEIDCGACPPEGGDDVTPPAFDGVDDTEERGRDECVISWEPAADDVTPEDEIVYEVFATERDGRFDFTRPVATTAAGATSQVIRLAAGRRFDIAVRAIDQAGNRDENDRARDCDFR